MIVAQPNLDSNKVKASTFSYREFGKWFAENFKQNVYSALGLLGFGMVLPGIIHTLKQYDLVLAHSLVADVQFSILFESMFNSHAPMLLGFIIYANTLIMLFMTDFCIAFSKKIYSLILSASIAAVIASLLIMAGYYLELVSGKPDWLDLWAMTINYFLTTGFAMMFLLVSTALFESPNRGTPLQYIFLLFSYVGTGCILVSTNLSDAAQTCLIILVGNCSAANGVVLGLEGRESLKTNPPLDKLTGAIGMVVVGILYAGVLFLACNVTFSTKEILCYCDNSMLADQCEEFKYIQRERNALLTNIGNK